MYLPEGALSRRTEVSVKICLGELRAWLFQAAPCLSMPARRASLWEALLAELDQPLVMRCLFKKVSTVTSL